MAKRPCVSDHSPMASKRHCNRSNINALLESLFTVSDSDLIDVDASFDVLVECRSTDSDQSDFLQRAIHIGSLILEAGKRSYRKHSSVHNASAWPLPSELTIKVFSMLDTPSVCSVLATCSFFQKCAIDPLCYANIDMTTSVPNNDAVVSTMIQRAGNGLQSIKLGALPVPPNSRYDVWGMSWSDKPSGQRKNSPVLTRHCLSSLSANGGAPGPFFRRLHLHNIVIDNTTLSEALSVCPLLIDIEIMYLDVHVNHTLESVSRHCRLLERFIFENVPGRNSTLYDSACEEFVLNCPKITTLALKACEVDGPNARMLVKGFQELKYVDFTESASFTGGFLKNLGTKGDGNNLEVMILRDCCQLKLSAVERFMEALLAGGFKLLRHLDISHIHNLGYFLRRKSTLIKQLLEQRPNFIFVAECQPCRSGYSPTICTSDNSCDDYNTSDSSSNISISEKDDSEESSSCNNGVSEEGSEESSSIASKDSSDDD